MSSLTYLSLINPQPQFLKPDLSFEIRIIGNSRYSFYFFLYSVILLGACSQSHSPKPDLIKGLSLVAPRVGFDTNAMSSVRKINSNWVAVIPYAFCRPGETNVYYDHQNSNPRWWGEGRTGVEETICLAREQGLKVMLKPQIWVGGSWIGNLSYENPLDWDLWEQSYEAFILPFARMCEEKGVELLCIGTELKGSVTTRPAFWNQLIQKIRKEYGGKLTYAANWDEYPAIRFWPELDFIGVDAYFPLTDQTHPSVKELTRAWDPVLDKLERFSGKKRRPVIFTEFGYLSVDGSGGKTWELEGNLKALAYNPEAQASCFNALFESCSKRDFWQGGFVWKWYPDLDYRKHNMEKDHSPQGKPAEEILRQWYARL